MFEGVNLEQKSGGLAVDQFVQNWFCKARYKTVPISGPLIKQKELEAGRKILQPQMAGWTVFVGDKHHL